MRKIKKRLPKTPSENTPRARELHTHQTDAERLLWSRLRSKQLRVKFRRQEPIGHYIVDFACIEEGIVIELDGSQHCQDKGREYDIVRDDYLKSLGFRVMRFSNYDVLTNLDGVLSTILNKVAPPFIPPREPGGR